jgi:hypothetical protein
MRLPRSHLEQAIWLAAMALIDLVLLLIIALLAVDDDGLALAGILVLGGAAIGCGIIAWWRLRQVLVDRDFTAYRLQSRLQQRELELGQTTSFAELLIAPIASGVSGRPVSPMSGGSTTTTLTVLPPRATSAI